MLSKNDRKIWISPGYGADVQLVAGVNGEIVRNIIIPEFKKGSFYSGLDKGAEAIFKVLTGKYKGERKEEGIILPILIIIAFVIIFLILVSKNQGNNGGNSGGFGAPNLLDVIILSSMGRGGGSYGGGSSSGGGFGGGFSDGSEVVAFGATGSEDLDLFHGF